MVFQDLFFPGEDRKDIITSPSGERTNRNGKSSFCYRSVTQLTNPLHTTALWAWAFRNRPAANVAMETPPKPENDGFQKQSPFPPGHFQVPCLLNFRDVKCTGFGTKVCHTVGS